MGMRGGGVAGTKALGDRNAWHSRGNCSNSSEFQVRSRRADSSQRRGRAIVWRWLCPEEGADRGGWAIVCCTQLSLPALVRLEAET